MRREGECFTMCLWEGDLLGAASAPQAVRTNESMDCKLWSGLPRELLEKAVVVMLPASSKCRFRAVCRRWRRLLSSPLACAPSASPPLLGKLYWGRDTDRHMKPLNEKVKLKEQGALKLALSNVPRSRLVPRDCVVDLPSVPPLEGVYDGWVVQGGLLCLVYGTDSWPAETDILIVNPMNGTWKCLPTCDWAGLKDWSAGVVVSRLPDCAFHVLVAGWTNETSKRATLWRYSSASNLWELFRGPTDDCCGEFTPVAQFALTSNTLYIVDRTAQAILLYTAEAGGLSKQTLPLPCPYSGAAETLAQVLKVVSHLDKVYAVGTFGHRNGVLMLGVSEEMEGPYGVAVWDLNVTKKCWELGSDAPEAVYGDYRAASAVRSTGNVRFPDVTSLLITRVEVVGDLACISLWVYLQVAEGIADVQELPQLRQDVYYNFADKSWHNGRKFLCPNATGAFSDQVMVDQGSAYFEPRLDIRLPHT